MTYGGSGSLCNLLARVQQLPALRHYSIRVLREDSWSAQLKFWAGCWSLTAMAGLSGTIWCGWETQVFCARIGVKIGGSGLSVINTDLTIYQQENNFQQNILARVYSLGNKILLDSLFKNWNILDFKFRIPKLERVWMAFKVPEFYLICLDFKKTTVILATYLLRDVLLE